MSTFAIRTTPRRAAEVVAATTIAIATAGLVAACSSSGSGGKTNAATQPPASAPASTQPAATGTTIGITETEFHIKLDKSAVKAGTYTFDVKNAGSIVHAINFDGPGVEDKTTGDIQAGNTGKVTVTLKPGMYRVYCPVGNHKAMGMDTMLMVS